MIAALCGLDKTCPVQTGVGPVILLSGTGEVPAYSPKGARELPDSWVHGLLYSTGNPTQESASKDDGGKVGHCRGTVKPCAGLQSGSQSFLVHCIQWSDRRTQ